MPTGHPTVVIDGKRTCIRCGITADESEFEPQDRNKGTFRNICKPCWRIDRNNMWVEKGAAISERRRERYANEPELREKRRLLVSPPRDSIKERCYRHHISIEYYYQMLDDQDGLCPICECELTPEVVPSLDHDHACCPNSGGRSCGECIRGILCMRCNKGLGFYEPRADAMSAYLEKNALHARA